MKLRHTINAVYSAIPCSLRDLFESCLDYTLRSLKVKGEDYRVSLAEGGRWQFRKEDTLKLSALLPHPLKTAAPRRNC